MQQYKKILGKVMMTAEGTYDSNKEYDPISLITDEETGKSYISRKEVPAGTQINNREYWQPVASSGIIDNGVIILNRKNSDGQVPIYDLKSATEAVAVGDRKGGVILGFLGFNPETDTVPTWKLYQYNDVSPSNWTNIDYWLLMDYTNKYAGWFDNEEALYDSVPFPKVGMYAYVGNSASSAVVYRCYDDRVWQPTEDKAFSGVVNLADEEDITSKQNKLKFKDKEYNPAQFSGLGKLYLRKNIIDGKNILMQDMMQATNTIYIIQYDYDLQGVEITIPEGCTLDFQGGSFSNGTIVGNNTLIDAGEDSVFKSDIKLSGNYINSFLYSSNFYVTNDSDVTEALQNAINNTESAKIKKLILNKGSYYISGTIKIPSRFDFGGVENDSLAVWKYVGEVPTITQKSNTASFQLNDNVEARNVSLHDIAIVPNENILRANDTVAIFTSGVERVNNCSFKNIYIKGFKYGMRFNIANDGGFTNNVFVNVGIIRCTIGLLIETNEYSSGTWVNHNWFRTCYLNENKCGAVSISKIPSIQTLTFQSCNFEANGKDSDELDYNNYGCFAFNADRMSSGCVLFDSCYFENNYPRTETSQVLSMMDYKKEGTIVFSNGQIEIRNSVIARTRQFVNVLANGSVFLTKNDYYLSSRIDDSFSTSLIRYNKITNSNLVCVKIEEPKLGHRDTYIDSPYEFGYDNLSSSNTLYHGSIYIDSPLFKKEVTRKGVYDTDVTLFLDASNGHKDYNGLNPKKSFPNFSAIRAYGSNRYKQVNRCTIELLTDIIDNSVRFGTDDYVENIDIVVKGNGKTITIKDKSTFCIKNAKIRFENCKIVIDNQTAYYKTFFTKGFCQFVFKNCEIIFNTGLNTQLIDCQGGGKVDCYLEYTTLSFLQTPSESFFLTKERNDAIINIYQTDFINESNVKILSKTTFTNNIEDFIENYSGYPSLPITRRENGESFLYSDKSSKLRNLDGTYLSNVTII